MNKIGSHSCGKRHDGSPKRNHHQSGVQIQETVSSVPSHYNSHT
jgi:hypothetical protein